MKKKMIVPIMMTGILVTSSIIGFAATVNKDIARETLETEKTHWAQQYVEKLQESYTTVDVLQNEDLNQVITIEKLQQLIQATIDSDFSKQLDSVSREEVVNAMMEIWASKTGEKLEEQMIPKILIYSDTGAIETSYVHNVMLAYFNNIAKGRESNLFVPKAPVTYGEAVTLIAKLQDAIDEKNQKDETPVKEEKQEEKLFETTATYKIVENGVVFDFQLTNSAKEAQDISFSSGQQYEIKIFDGEGNHLYTYSADKMFTMALIMKTIEAGESLVWQETWETIDHNGNPITEGDFEAVITIVLMEENIGKEQLTTKVNFSL